MPIECFLGFIVVHHLEILHISIVLAMYIEICSQFTTIYHGLNIKFIRILIFDDQVT